jgi:hypothetical protein
MCDIDQQTNKVGSVIVKHNRDDMKEIRETIVVENEMCGFENPNLVNVESEPFYLDQRCLPHSTMCDIDQQSHTLYILTSLSKEIPTFWMQWSQTLVLHHNHFSQLHVQSDGVLTILDVDQSPCPPMLLRPRPKSPGVLDDFLESTVSDPDNHTYKHYVPSLVSVLPVSQY